MLFPTKFHRGFYYQVVYSPDDVGYYAEVLNYRAETLEITGIVMTRLHAEESAKVFINGRLDNEDKANNS